MFFRKFPASLDAYPNAVLLRKMGELNGCSLVEILYREERWIVKESEAMSAEQAFCERARRWKAELDAINPKPVTKEALARLLQITTVTLRKRLKAIREHLTKKEPQCRQRNGA